MFDGCLYFNTTALARMLERHWAVAFAPFELTVPQAFMLRAVLARPGVSPGELAETMVIARPTATRALDGLLAKGLVERRVSERDRREQSLYPTASAGELESALNEASASVTRGLKRRLGAETFNETVGSLRQVRGALE